MKTTSRLLLTRLLTLALLALLAVPGLYAQNRPPSPPGYAATQVGGEWKDVDGRQRYTDGKWIEVTYNRPILRQRDDIFGSGEDYGKRVTAGAPVWRFGANQSTRLKTEVALKIGDKTVPAGEYSLYVDLKGPDDWTLIVSNWAAQEQFSRDNKEALWGSYGYTPDKDVARAKMETMPLDYRIDQMTIGFSDVTKDGGNLFMIWDKTFASVAFMVAE